MSGFREAIIGTPVSVKTAAERRALIGKNIAWHEAGWRTQRSGKVTACDGKNMEIEGDWKWAPSMLNVHIVGGEP